MSSLINDVVVTLLFNDNSTRNITLEKVANADLNSVSSKIQSINANVNNEFANFYQTFVSDDGAPVVRIESCRIVMTQEEVIYSG